MNTTVLRLIGDITMIVHFCIMRRILCYKVLHISFSLNLFYLRYAADKCEKFKVMSHIYRMQYTVLPAAHHMYK